MQILEQAWQRTDKFAALGWVQWLEMPEFVPSLVSVASSGVVNAGHRKWAQRARLPFGTALSDAAHLPLARHGRLLGYV
jgi:hypothetical protein